MCHQDGDTSYGQEPWQGGILVIWACGGGLLRVILAGGGMWTRPKLVEVVPEHVAGRHWSDWPPDEDEGCGVALGGLGSVLGHVWTTWCWCWTGCWASVQWARGRVRLGRAVVVS